jgi:hypothetical protein
MIPQRPDVAREAGAYRRAAAELELLASCPDGTEHYHTQRVEDALRLCRASTALRRDGQTDAHWAIWVGIAAALIACLLVDWMFP